LNQYTNKVVCVFCWRLWWTEEPSTHSYRTLTNTMQFSHHISFKHWHKHYNPQSPKWFLLFRFSKQTLYYLLFTICMLHATLCIMLIISGEERVIDTKLFNLLHPSVHTSPSHQIFSSPPRSHKSSVCVLLLT